MNRWLFSIVLILCLATLSLAQQKNTNSKLPVKKIILYSHGVGYFERQGVVEGSQNIEIEFTGNQMNDVLKSLLVLDLNGGQISFIGYDTAKPIDRQLAQFGLDLTTDAPDSLTTLIGQMKGTRVEIKTNGGLVEGKIVGLEKRQRQQNTNVMDILSLVIATNNRSLESFDLTEIRGIRILDDKLATDLEHYLEILGSSHKKTGRNLVIAAQGEGSRKIVAGYTIEAPVWKTSYRVVLDEKGKPFLQGWAIVDNEQDEDWENVQLSMVSGSPVSFIQDLHSARYQRRPVIPFRKDLALSPQTYEESYESGVDAGVEGGVVGGVAGGVVGGVLGGSAQEFIPPPPAVSPDKPETYIDIASMAAQSTPIKASGNEVGDLFEYKVDHPVSIRHNSSAMLPIVSSKLEGERICIFNEANKLKNPMSGILLHNTTKFTLEAGPLTVFEGNTYAGEALLERLKPNEKSYLTFAADLGTFISTEFGTDQEQVATIKVDKGTLKAFFKQVETKIYTIANKDNRAKTVLIEHPRRQYWQLKSATKEPFETTENFLRFRLTIEPNATVKLPVIEELPQYTAYIITNVTPDDISLFVSKRYIDADVEKVLQKIMAIKNQIVGINVEISGKNQRIQEITSDQGRLRENIKAIGKSEEEKKLLARYTQKLNETEDQLEELHNDIKTLNGKRVQYQDDLDKTLISLEGYEHKL